jgi:hypothetical protein
VPSECERRRLGLGQPIARRDFLNGLAIAISGQCGFFSRSQGTGEMHFTQPQPGDLETTDS